MTTQIATRGLVFERPGEPLVDGDLLLDPPGPGEVLVRLLASGICHSDLHTLDGEWEAAEPLVLGHEGAGIVEAVGPGVESPAIGDLVVLSWLAPCHLCVACQRGQPWLCSRTRALEHRMPDGTTRLHDRRGREVFPYLGIGTFLERTVVPASAAITVPPETPPASAALIGCCVSTGIGSVTRVAAVPEGATVAIIGLGGVGLSLILGAVLAGAARIIAIDRVAAKLDRARTVGATDTILATDPETTEAAVRDLTDGGADFAFEAIGLVPTIEQSIRLLRPGGTAVVVGMTPLGRRASFDAFDLADRSLRVIGSNYGSTIAASDFPRYAGLANAGRLPIDLLVDAVIGPEQVNDALDAVRRGDSVRQVLVRGVEAREA